MPAGIIQPCCQPLTVTGVSAAPSAVRAVQPGLMLSGTTSTRGACEAGMSTSRWSALHAPVSTGTVAAVGNWLSCGPASWTPSTTNAAPGLISSSCWPAGNVIGSDWHALAGIGSPSSSAATVVSTEVCTNWPATAIIGPRPQGRVIAPVTVAAGVGCGDRLPTTVERLDLGEAGRFQLVETQCGAVDHVVPVQDRQHDGVGDAGSQRQRLRAAVGVEPAHLRTVAEVDRDQRRVRGQLRRTRRHPQRRHLAAGGQLQREVGRGPVLRDALRSGPSGVRVAVGGCVGRAQHVDRVGVAVGACGVRLADQVGQLGSLARAHPHRRRQRDRLRDGQGAAQVNRLLRRQRHRRRAPDAVGTFGAAGSAQQLRPQIPLCDNGIRRRAGHQHGVPQG